MDICLIQIVSQETVVNPMIPYYDYLSGITDG